MTKNEEKQKTDVCCPNRNGIMTQFSIPSTRQNSLEHRVLYSTVPIGTVLYCTSTRAYHTAIYVHYVAQYSSVRTIYILLFFVYTMALSLAALLFSFSLSHCHAFVPSLVHGPHALSLSQSQRSRSSCSSLHVCSMVTESSNPQSVQQQQQQQQLTLNTRLDQLASRCSDPKEHVILLASQCEDLFRQQQSEEEADLASFNVHLRAWKNTCATLAQHRHHNSGTVDQIPSVPVYTARDAVERATNIVLEMERLSKENPDSNIVPDVTSYNILIGAYCTFQTYKMCVCVRAFD